MWRLRDRARSVAMDDGFSLIEVVVALTIVLIVMTSSLAFFLRSMQTSSVNQQRQAAASIGEQAMEQWRNVNPADLLCGRSTVIGPAPTPAVVDLNNTTQATISSSADCPTSTPVPLATSVPNGPTTYNVATYIGACYLPSGTGSSTATCTTTSGAGTESIPMYRVIVDVSWTPAKGHGCPTSLGCNYVLSTLRDPNVDPTFAPAG